MCEIERYSDPGDSVWRAPFVAEPEVDSKSPKPCARKLFPESFHTVLEPGILNAETEVAQANVEELLRW